MTNAQDQDQTTPPPSRRLGRMRAAAKKRGLTVGFLYGLVRRGKVRAYRVGERLTMVDEQDIDDYLVSRPIDLSELTPYAAIRARSAKCAAARASKSVNAVASAANGASKQSKRASKARRTSSLGHGPSP